MEINSPALARRPARRQPRLAMRCWLRSCPQASPGLPCAWESGSGEQPLKCEPQSKRGPYEREKKREKLHPSYSFCSFPSAPVVVCTGREGCGKGMALPTGLVSNPDLPQDVDSPSASSNPAKNQLLHQRGWIQPCPEILPGREKKRVSTFQGEIFMADFPRNPYTVADNASRLRKWLVF